VNISLEAISNKLVTHRDVEFFNNRIVNMWNSLPDYVVMSDTINTFKNRLDAHWKHRDFLFHYRATYTRTRDQNYMF